MTYSRSKAHLLICRKQGSEGTTEEIIYIFSDDYEAKLIWMGFQENREPNEEYYLKTEGHFYNEDGW